MPSNPIIYIKLIYSNYTCTVQHAKPCSYLFFYGVVEFTLPEATKAQWGSRGIVLLFL